MTKEMWEAGRKHNAEKQKIEGMRSCAVKSLKLKVLHGCSC